MKMRIRIAFWLGFRRLAPARASPDPGRLWKKARTRLLDRLRREEMDQELFSSCVILRNLAIAQKDTPMSLDSILEELMKSSRAMRSVYEETLFLRRNGQEGQAFQVLRERTGNRAGEQLAYLLSGLERINPAELAGAVEQVETAFSESRTTAAMKRASQKSFLATLAATASVLSVLMNFSVVVVFMDMMQILGGMGV